jgi:hypothetical protein
VGEVTCWSILFDGKFEPLSDAIIRQEKTVATVLERTAPAHRDTMEKEALGSMRSAIRELLDVPIADRLVEAFCSYRDLLALADTQQDGNEIVEKAYGEKDVAIRYEPSIRVRMNGVELSRVNIAAALSLKMTGVVLTVRRGRIQSFTVGSMAAQGTLDVGSSRVYATPSARIFDGFSRDLGAGVPIASGRPHGQ